MSSRAGSSAAFEILSTTGRSPSIMNVWSRSLSTATAAPSTPNTSPARLAASTSLKDGGAAVRTSSMAASVTASG
jgi:hypothetical protein